MDIHPTIFGSFSNEIGEDEVILTFAGMGSKNYAYETINRETGKIANRVCKIRGLTLSGEAAEKMNIDLILQFVENLQNGKLSSANVPQFRIMIDGVTKQLSARETESIYKNNSN